MGAVDRIARAIMILIAKKTKKDWRGLKLKPGLVSVLLSGYPYI